MNAQYNFFLSHKIYRCKYVSSRGCDTTVVYLATRVDIVKGEIKITVRTVRNTDTAMNTVTTI